MLGSPQHHPSGNGGNSLIDPFSTIMGNTSGGVSGGDIRGATATAGMSSNAFGGAGRTYQSGSGMMTLDEPAVINNKTSFLQNLNHPQAHQMFLDSDDNSSPCQGNATAQIMMKSLDKMHYPRAGGPSPHNQ